MVSRGPQRIRVQIDELVLEGVTQARRDRVAAAFERELGRLLRAAPPAERPAALRRPPPVVPLHGSADRIGRALARSVHAALAPPQPLRTREPAPAAPDPGGEPR